MSFSKPLVAKLGLCTGLIFCGLFSVQSVLAHPSDNLCEKLGGKVLTLEVMGKALDKELHGKLCELNRALVTTMSLWRALTTHDDPAINRFLMDGKLGTWTGGNPAAVYCDQIGGVLIPVKYPDGGEDAWCEFTEGGHVSMIAQWTLMRGPKSTSNERLMEVLRGPLPDGLTD